MLLVEFNSAHDECELNTSHVHDFEMPEPQVFSTLEEAEAYVEANPQPHFDYTIHNVQYGENKGKVELDYGDEDEVMLNGFNVQHNQKLIPYWGADGNVEGVQLIVNTKKEVCPRCEGEGRHTNPSIDGNGITQSEMEELGEDFRDDYMSGVYDVQCEQCKGLRVVDVPDENNNPKWVMEYIEKQEEEDYNDRRMHEMEIRMGA